MTRAERRCPVHAEPDADVLHAWPCPDDCQDFLAELERRIEDMQVHGNFIKTWRDEHGVFYKQEFRNHERVGEPVNWRVMNEETK